MKINNKLILNILLLDFFYSEIKIKKDIKQNILIRNLKVTQKKALADRGALIIPEKTAKQQGLINSLISTNVIDNFQQKKIFLKKLSIKSYKKEREIRRINLDIASSFDILKWAEKTLPNGKIIGKITNANTLHYKTFKPQKGGLFCERIFGPLKDFECACGKIQKSHLSIFQKEESLNNSHLPFHNYKKTVAFLNKSKLNKNKKVSSYMTKKFCDICDVEYTWSIFRRYQLGYIQLILPITHVWYIKGAKSLLGNLLGLKKKAILALVYNSEITVLETSQLAIQNFSQGDISPVRIFKSWKKITDKNEIKKDLLKSKKTKDVLEEVSSPFSELPSSFLLSEEKMTSSSSSWYKKEQNFPKEERSNEYERNKSSIFSDLSILDDPYIVSILPTTKLSILQKRMKNNKLLLKNTVFQIASLRLFIRTLVKKKTSLLKSASSALLTPYNKSNIDISIRQNNSMTANTESFTNINSLSLKKLISKVQPFTSLKQILLKPSLRYGAKAEKKKALNTSFVWKSFYNQAFEKAYQKYIPRLINKILFSSYSYSNSQDDFIANSAINQLTDETRRNEVLSSLNIVNTRKKKVSIRRNSSNKKHCFSSTSFVGKKNRLSQIETSFRLDFLKIVMVPFQIKNEKIIEKKVFKQFNEFLKDFKENNFLRRVSSESKFYPSKWIKTSKWITVSRLNKEIESKFYPSKWIKTSRLNKEMVNIFYPSKWIKTSRLNKKMVSKFYPSKFYPSKWIKTNRLNKEIVSTKISVNKFFIYKNNLFFRMQTYFSIFTPYRMKKKSNRRVLSKKNTVFQTAFSKLQDKSKKETTMSPKKHSLGNSLEIYISDTGIEQSIRVFKNKVTEGEKYLKKINKIKNYISDFPIESFEFLIHEKQKTRQQKDKFYVLFNLLVNILGSLLILFYGASSFISNSKKKRRQNIKLFSSMLTLSEGKKVFSDETRRMKNTVFQTEKNFFLTSLKRNIQFRKTIIENLSENHFKTNFVFHKHLTTRTLFPLFEKQSFSFDEFGRKEIKQNTNFLNLGFLKIKNQLICLSTQSYLTLNKITNLPLVLGQQSKCNKTYLGLNLQNSIRFLCKVTLPNDVTFFYIRKLVLNYLDSKSPRFCSKSIFVKYYNLFQSNIRLEKDVFKQNIDKKPETYSSLFAPYGAEIKSPSFNKNSIEEEKKEKRESSKETSLTDFENSEYKKNTRIDLRQNDRVQIKNWRSGKENSAMSEEDKKLESFYKDNNTQYFLNNETQDIEASLEKQSFSFRRNSSKKKQFFQKNNVWLNEFNKSKQDSIVQKGCFNNFYQFSFLFGWENYRSVHFILSYVTSSAKLQDIFLSRANSSRNKSLTNRFEEEAISNLNSTETIKKQDQARILSEKEVSSVLFSESPQHLNNFSLGNALTDPSFSGAGLIQKIFTTLSPKVCLVQNLIDLKKVYIKIAEQQKKIRLYKIAIKIVKNIKSIQKKHKNYINKKNLNQSLLVEKQFYSKEEETRRKTNPNSNLDQDQYEERRKRDVSFLKEFARQLFQLFEEIDSNWLKGFYFKVWFSQHLGSQRFKTTEKKTFESQKHVSSFEGISFHSMRLEKIREAIINPLGEIPPLSYKESIKETLINTKKLNEIRPKLIKRIKLLRLFVKSNSTYDSMILNVLPVLPADLRPIMKLGDQIAASDLNRLYQRILYRNDRLKKFLKDSVTTNSEVARFAHRLLQEAVDNLIENGKSGVKPETDSRGRVLKSLTNLLKGKEGRFRQNLLGKRVDYSGRSVIVVGPKLKIHECGLPYDMAIELFLPFLAKRLLNYNLAQTVIGAKSLIQTNKPLIKELLREIMKVHPVLLNRAPTLHRLGIQAFQPKLVDGKAILLHPLVCPAFNADFDGDQMAVHVPITVEARAESLKLMFSRNNLLSSATGDPLVLPSQDMVLGCYYLTIEKPILTKYNLSKNIKKSSKNMALFFSKKTNKNDVFLKEMSNTTQSIIEREDVSKSLATVETSLLFSEHDSKELRLNRQEGTWENILTNNHSNHNSILYSPTFFETQKFLNIPFHNSLYFNSIEEALTKYNNIKVTAIAPFRIHHFLNKGIRKNRKQTQLETKQKNRIQTNPIYSPNLQSLVWVKWENSFETGIDRENPLEIRINRFGIRQDIYHKFLRSYDKENNKMNQLIRTTPGKIIFNFLIQKSLKGIL